MSLDEIITEHIDGMYVASVLQNPAIGHTAAAQAIQHKTKESVSEASVRRYRRKHGIELQTEVPAVVEPEATDSNDTEYLRKELIRVGKLYEKEKTSNKVYADTIYSVVREFIEEERRELAANGYGEWESVALGDTSKFLRDNNSLGDEEVAVALVSDLQLAKVTKEGDEVRYNSAIAEVRMQQYLAKILNVTNVQREDHPVHKIVVPVLGDIIEGEEIFPGQMWLIDGGLYRQIAVDGPRIFVNFFRGLLDHFNEVEVVWVPGNHGRIGGIAARNHDPETNGDRILGKIVEMLMESESRIKFKVTDGQGEKNWFDFVNIGNYSALCLHGNQVAYSIVGIAKKVNGWAAGAIKTPFQDVYMGHWHQRALIPVNQRNVYINGSTESYSTYAQEVLAAMSNPSQWLLFVHPERGMVTASYGIELT